MYFSSDAFDDRCGGDNRTVRERMDEKKDKWVDDEDVDVGRFLAGREFWHKMAKESLQKALNQKPIESRAKNVVLFLGDGMGVSTVSAGRILAGQLQGRNGEETILSFENFPHVALSKVK